MTYKEAFELAQKYKGLYENYRPIDKKGIPAWIHGVFIAPKRSTLVEVSQILGELAVNNFDNELTLKEMGLFDEDLDVYIVGERGGTAGIISLTTHLKNEEGQ